jgi:hypothetical protein
MEFHDDTTFDATAGVDHGADSFGADHDNGLGDTMSGDDHYGMVANTGSGDDSSPYGDSSDTGDSGSPYGGGEAAGYSDSSTDGSAADGSSGTVSIVVDGQEYTEAGTPDSSGALEADVHLPDGDTVQAIDTDHDGQADHAIIYDSSGNPIDAQHVDPSTGEWIDDAPGGSGSGGTDGTDPTDGTDSGATGQSTGDTSETGSDDSGDTGSTDAVPPGHIEVEVNGQEMVGTETIDVNHDGQADSAVMEADGKTYLLTDLNGDGRADHVEVGEDGQWKGGYMIEGDGQYQPDPGTTPDPSDMPSFAVDPQTGEWVSDNS